LCHFSNKEEDKNSSVKFFLAHQHRHCRQHAQWMFTHKKNEDDKEKCLLLFLSILIAFALYFSFLWNCFNLRVIVAGIFVIEIF
jgi:hypothetical protein